MKKNYTKITFFFIVVVLVVVSLLTYKNLTNYINEVKSIRHSNQVLRTIEITLSSIKDAETGHRGYQLTRDSSFLEPYNNSVEKIPLLIARLDRLVMDNLVQQRRMDSLKVFLNDQLLLIPQILANTNQSSLYMDTYEKSLLFRSKHNMENIRAQTKEIIIAEEDILNQRVKKESDFRNIAPFAILLYALFAIGGAIVLFFRILEALRKQEKAKTQLAKSNQFLKEEVRVREFTQTLLRSVLDNSPRGILACKSIRNEANEIFDFETILANNASQEAAQKKEDEIVGKKLREVFPTIKTQLFDVFKKVVEGGETVSIDSYNQPDTNKWYSINVAKLGDGFVVTYTDITDQREKVILANERALLLKEAELLANMGSWKWTLKTKQMVWSDGLSRILGNTSKNENSWEAFIECAHSNDKEMLRTFITNAMNMLEGFRMEYRCVVRGEIRNFYISVTAETEIEKGNILGVVVDITELKEKELELGLINSDLKRSNEDLEQFAYVASHDLQEPLRKIRAFGDLLSTKFSTQLEDTGSDYIARMQSAAARMQVLIQDLLAFSRVSKSSVQTEVVNLNLVVAEIMDDLENQILRENATIQIGQLVSIKGDRPQLKRLFQNLISNAIKFHKATTHSQVNIQSTQLAQTDIKKYFPTAQAGSAYAAISVEDNGIGFNPIYAEQIFNIFQRLHGRLHFEGTGIGLAICRKIVSNHRGIIVAEGEENKGSKFIVIFPLI